MSKKYLSYFEDENERVKVEVLANNKSNALRKFEVLNNEVEKLKNKKFNGETGIYHCGNFEDINDKDRNDMLRNGFIISNEKNEKLTEESENENRYFSS